MGPNENYCDMNHAAHMGIFHSTAQQEYVPYIRPQEHGNHTQVRWLQIGALRFEGCFEAAVSAYSTRQIEKAQHINELSQPIRHPSAHRLSMCRHWLSFLRARAARAIQTDR